MAGVSAAASPRALTTSDMVWSVKLHCGALTYTAAVSFSASDICFTSATTPTTV